MYKIGDLGHVTKISAPSVDDEGDCRYLPKEVLQQVTLLFFLWSALTCQNFAHIAKADIFSLGMTAYEAATLVELPKNGPDWHQVWPPLI